MEMPALNVLIQINISDENSKSGITLGELEALAADGGAAALNPARADGYPGARVKL